MTREIAVDSETFSREDVVDRIAKTTYRYVENTTICVIKLDNGYVGVGYSTPTYDKEYSKARGKELARQKAIDKLWTVYKFWMADWHYRGLDMLSAEQHELADFYAQKRLKPIDNKSNTCTTLSKGKKNV